MPRKKITDILENPYTGEQIEISASTEEIFERRCNEQYRKWDNEQYVREAHAEAKRKTFEQKERDRYLRNLCCENLRPLKPERYIKEILGSIHQRYRYQPTLKEVRKEAGLNWKIELASIFSKKYREKEEKIRHDALMQWINKMDEYDEKVKEDQKEYDAKRKELKEKLLHQLFLQSQGNSHCANEYYSYVLDRDDFSVDGINRYKNDHGIIRFNKKTGEIRLVYRIPDKDEISTVAEYVYNEKKDVIEQKAFDAKTATKWRLRIAESVLLRCIALIFASDPFDIVKVISVHGYLQYYDPAYGDTQRKVVMHARITKDIFLKVDLKKVNPIDLFDRVLHVTTSSGLYSRESYELLEISE